MIQFTVNGATVSVDVDADMPLLWVLRDVLGLTGTKFGCGAGVCRACTVLIDGKPEQSCQIPASDAQGKAIITIEGLSADRSHPVQRAWIEGQVAQCGYCQPGMMLAAVGLLNEHPDPTDETIDEAMRNICRCGTHSRVRQAIHHAAVLAKTGKKEG